MEAVRLPASHVYPHPEARALDARKVAAIAESVREVGLLSPIIVREAMKLRNGVKAEAWEIVAGHHRYEACAVHLRWEEVPCVVVDTTDLLAELMSIDENLCRAELSPAEAAYQTARRKEVYEALHPETKHGVAGASTRWDAVDNLSTASFADSTASSTGRDPRSVRRDAARGEALGDDLKRIPGTSLDKGVELDALAKLPPEEREEIVSRAQRGERVSARRPTSVDDGRLNDHDAEEREFAALESAWNKARPSARERFRLEVIDGPVMDRGRFR